MTPTPPDPALAWTGIRWERLAASNPLSEIRSITPWPGGFIAIGALAAVDGGSPASIDEPVHTRIWVSSDGATWSLLPVDVLGPSTVVIGIAATADSIVALTAQSGRSFCADVAESRKRVECWTLAAPVQSWTSSDGAAWASHPGPDLALPDDMSGDVGQQPGLNAGTAPLVVASWYADGRAATSRDGATWQIVPATAPGGSIVGFGSGFVSIGGTTSKPAALTSPDGRTWTSHPLPTGCHGNDAFVVGPNGIILEGDRYNDGGTITVDWCSSLDGRSWRPLVGTPPLGLMDDPRAQECRGFCVDGTLLGDGSRFLAYRGWAKQVGWTSRDGRAWTPLSFAGWPERSTYWLDDQCTPSLTMSPIGVTCTDTTGHVWFGAPLT